MFGLEDDKVESKQNVSQEQMGTLGSDNLRRPIVESALPNTCRQRNGPMDKPDGTIWLVCQLDPRVLLALHTMLSVSFILRRMVL